VTKGELLKKNTYIYKRAEDLGISVVDAKDRAFVGVTADDVLSARKANSKHCALARASLRLPDVHAAYFFRRTAFLEYEDRILRFALPVSVQKEIVTFDRAQIFAPGVYQLSPPSPANTLASKAKHKRDIKSGRKKLTAHPTKPTERAALRVATLVMAKSDQKQERILEKAQKLEAPKATAGTSGKRARVAKDGTVNTNFRVSGAVGTKVKAPLLPNGRFYRRSQYVRDLDEPTP
jgi:hypothetical protein